MSAGQNRYEQDLLAETVVGLLRTKNLVATKWTQLWSNDLFDEAYTLIQAIDKVTDTIDAFELVDEIRKLICAELVVSLGKEPRSYDENRSLLITHNEAVLTERTGLMRLIDETVERLSARLEAIA